MLCYNMDEPANPKGGIVQLYYGSNNNAYIRYAFGKPSVFGQWRNLSNPLLNLAMFQRIGVIGDSYASGWLNVSGTAKDWYNISWIQQMARKNGITGINFSTGGLTTRTWITNANGLTKLNNESACDLYYFALGINDANVLGSNYLGTISDCTSNPANNPDTFYGNTDKILYYVKQKAPNALLLVMTMAENSGLYKDFNKAIADIATLRNYPLLTQYSNAFFNSDLYKYYKVGGHPTVQIYNGMSVAIEQMTIQYIEQNPSKFNSIYPTA